MEIHTITVWLITEQQRIKLKLYVKNTVLFGKSQKTTWQGKVALSVVY